LETQFGERSKLELTSSPKIHTELVLRHNGGGAMLYF